MRLGAAVAGTMLLLGAACAHDAPVGVPARAGRAPRGAALADAGYERVDLGTLGGARSYATDVNHRDVVVGWSETASGETHAFRWSEREGMVDLGTLPGHTSSQAVAILDGRMPDGGQILGMSSGPGGMKPVTWSADGEIRALSYPVHPAASFSYVFDANTSGVVVGWEPITVQEAFAWVPGRGKFDLDRLVPLQFAVESAAFDVTEGGWVLMTAGEVGGCGRGITSCWRSFLWHPDSGFIAVGTPGDVREFAVQSRDMNESRSVVGWLQAAYGSSQPYRWTQEEGFTMLPQAATSSGGYATAIANDGTAAGYVFDSSRGGATPMVWLRSGDYGYLDPDSQNPGVAQAINQHGHVTGWAVVGDGVNHAVLWRRWNGGGMKGRTAPSRRFTTPSSMRCLEDEAATRSRQALYACILAADRAP